MDINKRLLRLLKAVANDQAESISSFFDQRSFVLNDTLEKWERKYNIGGKSHEDVRKPGNDFSDSEPNGKTANSQENTSSKTGNFSQQFVEDLRLFGLTPPSSLAEIKKSRNREMKKFHPDRFMNDPEKMDTAKKIVQIYNSAYERLKKSFGP
ncbi:J domain-containing protein [bacterium]|nr:J domain-containing protein [bacterium]